MVRLAIVTIFFVWEVGGWGLEVVRGVGSIAVVMMVNGAFQAQADVFQEGSEMAPKRQGQTSCSVGRYVLRGWLTRREAVKFKKFGRWSSMVIEVTQRSPHRGARVRWADSVVALGSGTPSVVDFKHWRS